MGSIPVEITKLKSMLTIEIKSIEEAKAIRHCLIRTNARNTNGALDHSDAFLGRLDELIAKIDPLESETTQKHEDKIQKNT